MKKSDSLASVVKKDFEALEKKVKSFADDFETLRNKLDAFETRLIEDGCVAESICEYAKEQCEIKKPLDEILEHLDSYYK